MVYKSDVVLIEHRGEAQVVYQKWSHECVPLVDHKQRYHLIVLYYDYKIGLRILVYLLFYSQNFQIFRLFPMLHLLFFTCFRLFFKVLQNLLHKLHHLATFAHSIKKHDMLGTLYCSGIFTKRWVTLHMFSAEWVTLSHCFQLGHIV